MAQCRSTLVPEGSAPRSSCSIKLLQLRHLAIYFFGLSRSHPSILANLPRTLGWLSARDFLQAYCKAKKEKKLSAILQAWKYLFVVEEEMENWGLYLDLSAKVSLDLLLSVP
jgi:hypothetical protein